MKRIVWVILVALITACTASSSSPAVESESTYTAPIPQALSQSEFIDSDLTASWEWSTLDANQVFALRVWYENEAPQEIWLQETSASIQSMIDSYSRDVGTYYWQVVVVNTNEQGGFESTEGDWSEIIELHRVRRFTLEPYAPDLQSDMARFISEQGLETPFEIASFMRDFIHNNTNIVAQGDFEADFSDAMQQVFNHAIGEGESPELYCDGMSTGMLTTLLELGIESRLIFLYGQARGWYSQHTFLEIFNSDTQQWEVHDPTFNLYFMDTETGERASIERMVFGNPETLVACDNEANCSRDALSDTVGEYLDAYRIGHGADEVFVNPDRIDISVRNTGQENNNFPEFIARITGIPQRNLIFRFDSYLPPR